MTKLAYFLFFSVIFFSCSKKDDPVPPPPPVITAPVISSFSPGSGLAGDLIHIKGSNFSNKASDNHVEINGVVAEVKVAALDSLVVMVPGGASTGKITVTKSEKTATSLDDFVILNGPWIQRANIGSGGTPQAGFSIGSKLYVLFSTVPNGASIKMSQDLWAYDTVTNSWSKKADPPALFREFPSAFAIGNRGYFGLGYDEFTGQDANDFWEYNPDADQWNRKADFPGIARQSAASFSIGSKGYIGIGVSTFARTVTATFQDFWSYDPSTDIWTAISDFPGSARANASASANSTGGYLAFGEMDSNDLTSEFWHYNPSNNNWDSLPHFPGTGRMRANLLTIDNKIYAGFGSDNSILHNDWWEFDPATSTWSQKENALLSSRTAAIGFTIGHRGYIAGGISDEVEYLKKDLWIFTP